MNRLALILATLGLAAGGIAQTNYQNYTFFTLAGPPQPGPGSRDAIGAAARFNFAYAVAADSAGNVFVADTSSHTIRKIAPTGAVSTLAGLAGSAGSADGIGSQARFYAPTSLAVDAGGNVYVADTFNDTIRKITPGGVVTTLAGTPGSAGSADGTGREARFSRPYGIGVDSATNVYVSDTYNQTIRRITPDQVVTTLAGSVSLTGTNDGIGTAARFYYPCGVCADSAGNLFVIDSANSMIRKITPAGSVSTLAGNGSTGSADGTNGAATFYYPLGIGVRSDGVLFVADTDNGTVRQVTESGIVTTLAGSAGASGAADGTGAAARFNQPSSVTVDGAGNVYVADLGNCTIREISAGAVVTTLAGMPLAAGTNDGAGSLARFNYPSGVALDSGGNTYIADDKNCTIRKITPGGVVTTIAGTPGSAGTNDGLGAAALFDGPAAVVIDTATNVYVADTLNHTIRKIAPDGTVTTLAGTPGKTGTADGAGSSAGFNTPTGLALDGAGNIYIADSENHTIRKLTPAGIVSTIAGSAGAPGTSDGTGKSARFNTPRGVALDASTNLYVADSGNATIRKVTPAAAVSTLAGTPLVLGVTDGPGKSARFAVPFGIAVDASANLYVTDAYTNVIRKVVTTPSVQVYTLAGNPVAEGDADGTGVAATFAAPDGIAVDPQGNLYVASSQTHNIRKGNPALPDQPVVNLASAAPGVLRQFAVSNSTTTAWAWSVVRLPAASSAQFSGAATPTPTLTPDVPDTFVVHFEGQDAQGRWAIGDITLQTAEILLQQVDYTTNAGAIAINTYHGSGGDLIIPASLNGLPVTSIGPGAFSGSSGLTGISIPSTVTSIGSSAFYGCSSLARLSISNGVTSIGDSAFYGCQSLTNLAIPTSVTSIGNSAFHGCYSLTNVALPGGLTSIGSDAFGQCDALAKITIPSGVTTIGSQAFAGCGSLTAFTVQSPNSSFTSSAGVLFNKNQTLLIQYPPAKTGGSYSTPGSVTSIGDSAFYGSKALTTVTIGATVTTIGTSPFYACTSLTAININSANPAYASVGGVLFNKPQTLLIQYPPAKSGSGYTPPATVTAIGDSAFYACGGLASVTLPNSLTNIGNSAFDNCTGLTGAAIPPNVAAISGSAFYGCSSLAAFTVDAANTAYAAVDGVLFDRAQTAIIRYPPAKPDTTYTVPATVAVFGDWAFEGCYNLTGIYFPGNAPTLGTDVFDHHDVTTVYYLPGTADWTSLFAGLPVVLYGEQLQITPRSIGVIADQFGFTATGPSNLQIVLEACTNLATPVWAAVSTNTFTGGSAYLSDPQWTNHAVRFYRLSLP